MLGVWEGISLLHMQLHCTVSSVEEECVCELGYYHAPSIAFRHLPPNSARTVYATEGALALHLRAAV